MKNPSWVAFWKQKARQLKIQTYTLYYAYRDPRTPWYARGLAALVVVYAFSPIDLIPDFIPVLGYLDDLVLIPLGVYLSLKLIPAEVVADCRAKAEARLGDGKPKYKFMAGVIIAMWVGVILLAGALLVRMIHR